MPASPLPTELNKPRDDEPEPAATSGRTETDAAAEGYHRTGYRTTCSVRHRLLPLSVLLQYRSAATCAAHVGCAATDRDGSRSGASAGRSRHGEHPGVGVSVAETFIDEVCQRPQFAESDVRH